VRPQKRRERRTSIAIVINRIARVKVIATPSIVIVVIIVVEVGGEVGVKVRVKVGVGVVAAANLSLNPNQRVKAKVVHIAINLWGCSSKIKGLWASIAR
jgi:hypothetical protein